MSTRRSVSAILFDLEFFITNFEDYLEHLQVLEEEDNSWGQARYSLEQAITHLKLCSEALEEHNDR